MLRLIRTLKFIAKRMYYGHFIKKYDKQSDAIVDPKNCGLTHGFLRVPIDELLGDGMTEKLQKSALRVTPEEDRRIYTSWDIPAFLWEAVLKSDRLSSIAKDYIGPRVRLDDIYVKTVSDGLASGSEGWHNDHVGYRLKVFMVFDVSGDPSGTLIVPADRPNLYKVNFSDEFARMMGRPQKEVRVKEQRVSYRAGDCMVFDTNVLHRGDYSSGTGTRYCIVAEFIDRDKADRIVKFAPCGPGQGNRNVTIPPLEGVDVTQHPMIDGHLLRVVEKEHCYGYK